MATSYPLVLVRARVENADRETASAAPIIHLVVHAMVSVPSLPTSRLLRPSPTQPVAALAAENVVEATHLDVAGL